MSGNQSDSNSQEDTEVEQVPPIERHLRVKISIYPDETPTEDSTLEKEDLALPCVSIPEPVPDLVAIIEESILKPVPDSKIPYELPKEDTILEKQEPAVPCKSIPEPVSDSVVIVVESVLSNTVNTKNEAIKKSVSKPQLLVEECALNNTIISNKEAIKGLVSKPSRQTRAERQAEMIDSICSDLYEEINENGENGACCEKCTDCCCWSFSCNGINPCKNCCMCDSETKLKEKMTPALRRARNKGLGILRKIAFPLITDLVRDVWVTLELTTVLIGLGLTIAGTVLHGINFVGLFFTCIGSSLALFDGFCVLRQCRSCKSCCCNGRDIENLEVPKTTCCCSCLRHSYDVVRMVISEMLIYPVLMYSIFSVVVGRNYEGETHVERLGFSLFLLSCISLVLYNYIVRLIAIGGIIMGVWEVRSPTKEMRGNDEYYDTSIALYAFLYQLYFAVHIFLQMIVQVLMIIAIAAKIRYEYRHVYSEMSADGFPENTSIFVSPINGSVINPNTDVYISNHLLYMLVSGYFIPLMGFLTFFVVTYYWSQEMPIGLLIDMISIYKKGGKNDFLETNVTLNKQKNIVQGTFDSFFKTKTLLKEFDELRNVSFITKFMYPFKSPMPIIFCLTYGLLQASFVICAAVTYDDMGNLVVHILNGGGWILYLIVACAIGALANIYALLVAAVWVTIIIIVIILVILTILGYCLQGEEKEEKK